MGAILEIPEVRDRLSRLTVEEYHRLDEFNENGRRTELIRGLVIEKLSKSPLHRVIATLLHKMIQKQLSPGYVAWMEQPLTLGDSEPEPDISVTAGEEKDFFRAHPTTAELVIEVAISSAALDLELAALYAEAGVKEYWIVFGLERRVEVYRSPQQGVYREKLRFGSSSVIECASLPGVVISLAELFEGGR